MGKADDMQIETGHPWQRKQRMKRYMTLLILGTASFLVQCSGSIRGTVCRDLDASLWGVHFIERTKGACEGL